jgi:hypothetical protein
MALAAYKLFTPACLFRVLLCAALWLALFVSMCTSAREINHPPRFEYISRPCFLMQTLLIFIRFLVTVTQAKGGIYLKVYFGDVKGS